MATSRTHGKDLNFSYNGTGIESELNSVTITFAPPEAEITSFADTWGNYLAGKKNTTIEIDGTLDMAASTAEALILAQIGSGNVSTIHDATGSGPGANAPQYKCTSSGLTGTLVGSVRISLPVGEKAGFSATLQNSGSTTRAVA